MKENSGLDYTGFHGRIAQALNATKRVVGDAIKPTFSGRISDVRGSLIKATVPRGEIGHMCSMIEPDKGVVGQAEIVGFQGGDALLAPFGSKLGLSQRIEVASTGKLPHVTLSGASLGCMLDWTGKQTYRFAASNRDDAAETLALNVAPPLAVERVPVSEVFSTGVRVIDGLLTTGRGQRLGIYGNAGLGKSTLIEMVLSNASADVVVVALIGERGREVVEMVQKIEMSSQPGRICVFVSTSDRPAVERLNTAFAATSAAEFFRKKGLNVLLVIDSITRVARASRDIGLARGEPPTRRGFPPSVFEMLPPLFERAGAFKTGSITGLYTVLVEGEITEDPIAEETKSLLDGHILLSQTVSSKGIYPAVDVMASLSRNMRRLVSEDHWRAAQSVRTLIGAYAEIELLVRVGEFQRGQDIVADKALDAQGQIRSFLAQDIADTSVFEETLGALLEFEQ